MYPSVPVACAQHDMAKAGCRIQLVASVPNGPFWPPARSSQHRSPIKVAAAVARMRPPQAEDLMNPLLEDHFRDQPLRDPGAP